MSLFVSWLRTLRNRLRQAVEQDAARRASLRPELESLEDRSVPSGVSATYAVTQDWGSGFQGQIRLDNGQATPVANWRLEFDSAANITSVWDGRIVSHVGTHYVVENAGWNATLAAGSSVSFGFVASGPTAAPTGYLLNGQPLDVGPSTPVPTIQVGNVSVQEGNAGTTAATFTITLSAASTTPVTVAYATVNGTASAGSDYQPASGTLTFAPGQTSRTVAVSILGDTTVESDESFNLVLSAPTGATLAQSQATGTIRNDDTPTPGGAVNFAVTSDWGSGFNGQVTVTNQGTAWTGWTLGFDFSGSINSLWNAEIVSHTGDHYVVKNASWNGSVASGGSTSFGFTAGPSGVVPTNFSLNGATPQNQSPVAVNDAAFTTAGQAVVTSVLANDRDPNGDPLTVQSVTQSLNGAVNVGANGQVTYTPRVGFAGSDSYRYTIADGRGGTAIGTVTITVNQSNPTGTTTQFFSPYVDMTLYPTYSLVDAAQSHGIKDFTLAFIVAGPGGVPSWGGYGEYAVNGGAFDLALRAQIAGVRALGGDVMVSFGGANGLELAQAITDVTALKNAYQAVINAYGLTRLDFDIEGGAAADHASIDRRSQALAALQQDAAAAGRRLEIWLTLPALPTGLTHDGEYVVRSAVLAGVNLAGVNIMAMDYGDSAAPNPAGRMGDYAIQAAQSLFGQLRATYGSARTDAELWGMVGVTPMIGLNDVTTEVFDQQEARELLAFAQQQGIGRISMWSLNRDRANPNGAISYVEPTSSSLAQQMYEFAAIFATL